MKIKIVFGRSAYAFCGTDMESKIIQIAHAIDDVSRKEGTTRYLAGACSEDVLLGNSLLETKNGGVLEVDAVEEPFLNMGKTTDQIPVIIEDAIKKSLAPRAQRAADVGRTETDFAVSVTPIQHFSM